MSKELLKALTDVLDDLKLRKNLSEDDALNINHSVLMRAKKAVKNYLSQPEQENLTPRQGLEEYKKGYAQAELDLKRKSLSDDEIEQTTKNMSEFAADMFKAGIRAAERAQGIGEGNE